MSLKQTSLAHYEHADVHEIYDKVTELQEPYKDRQVLDFYYNRLGFSSPEIADTFDVATDDVLTALKFHNIPRRNESEAQKIRVLRDGGFRDKADTATASASFGGVDQFIEADD